MFFITFESLKLIWSLFTFISIYRLSFFPPKHPQAHTISISWFSDDSVGFDRYSNAPNIPRHLHYSMETKSISPPLTIYEEVSRTSVLFHIPVIALVYSTSLLHDFRTNLQDSDLMINSGAVIGKPIGNCEDRVRADYMQDPVPTSNILPAFGVHLYLLVSLLVFNSECLLRWTRLSTQNRVSNSSNLPKCCESHNQPPICIYVTTNFVNF